MDKELRELAGISVPTANGVFDTDKVVIGVPEKSGWCSCVLTDGRWADAVYYDAEEKKWFLPAERSYDEPVEVFVAVWTLLWST